jgi:hypothetical protein
MQIRALTLPGCHSSWDGVSVDKPAGAHNVAPSFALQLIQNTNPQELIHQSGQFPQQLSFSIVSYVGPFRILQPVSPESPRLPSRAQRLGTKAHCKTAYTTSADHLSVLITSSAHSSSPNSRRFLTPPPTSAEKPSS